MDSINPRNYEKDGPAHKLRSLDAKRERLQSDLRGAATWAGSALDMAHQLAVRTRSDRDARRLRDVESVVRTLRSLTSIR